MADNDGDFYEDRVDSQGQYHSSGIPLTPYERELVMILQEECAEVIVAASKLLRFGKGDRYNDGVENTKKLGLEIGDVLCMIRNTWKVGIITEKDIASGTARKDQRLNKFMQTKPDDCN